MVLELDREQVETMERFLDLAWFCGSRSGREQMQERGTESDPDLPAIAIRNLEADFKALMHASADALNLTVGETITMWHYLHEAWMAGNRTCEAEMMAIYLETQSDVGTEAQRWLEEAE